MNTMPKCEVGGNDLVLIINSYSYFWKWNVFKKDFIKNISLYAKLVKRKI